MDFYSILISILRWFSHGKWVPLGQTVEGGSKHSDLFTGIQWPLLRVIIIKLYSKNILVLLLIPPLTPIDLDLLLSSSPLLYIFFFFDTITPTPPILFILSRHILFRH